jgi:hypothetical protein
MRARAYQKMKFKIYSNHLPKPVQKVRVGRKALAWDFPFPKELSLNMVVRSP